jgi:transposase
VGFGRPSKYDPSYCEAVIEAGKQGFSLTAFAGSIGVCRDTITEWMKVHPDFSLAVKHHSAVRTHTLEGDLLNAETGPRVTSRIFALKNCAPDEWRDKQQLEHTGANGGAIQIVSKAQRDAAVKAALEADG